MVLFRMCRTSIQHADAETVDYTPYNQGFEDPDMEVMLTPTTENSSEKGHEMRVLRCDVGIHVFDKGEGFTVSKALTKYNNIHRLHLQNIQESSLERSKPLFLLLENSRSITRVLLEDSCEEAVAKVIQALTFSITQADSIHLSGNIVSQSVGERISRLLAHNCDLTEFIFCNNSMEKDVMSQIAVGIGQNSNLLKLELSGNSLGDEAISAISDAVCRNKSIEKLALDFNAFTIQGVQALTNMLCRKSLLKELCLFGNQIDGVGAKLLADALGKNACLESLDLSFNQLGSQGMKVIGIALTRNTTLKKLSIASNQVGTKGYVEFARLLPSMRGIEEINLGTMFDDAGIDAIVEGLKKNRSVTSLLLEAPMHEDEQGVDETIDFWLKLNRSWRSVLRSGKTAPPGVWAIVLEKAGNTVSPSGAPDALYLLLQEKPNIWFGSPSP